MAAEEDGVEDGVSSNSSSKPKPGCSPLAIVLFKKDVGQIVPGTQTGKEKIMAKRNKHAFKKFEKELKRKKKAKEKIARRQGKKDQETESDRT